MSVSSVVLRRLRLDGLRGSGTSLVPLWILFGLNAVDELDQAVFGVLSPEIRDTFGLTNTEVTAIAVVLAPVVILVSLPLGYLADRVSRKRLAIGGAGVWLAFGIGAGLAPTVAIFYLCRTLGALGRSVNGPTHRSLLSDYYAPEHRVGVFSAWRLANPLSHFVAPLCAGVLGAALGFRLTFVLFSIPTALMIVIAVRYLTDPIRGAHERRAQGADDATSMTEEAPPTWQESWRILNGVLTVSRLRRALPFLVGGVTGMALLRAPYYEEVFGMGAAARGALAAANEPFQVLGLLIGIPYATRVVRDAPDRLPRLFMFAAFAGAAGFVVIAVAPNVLVAGAATCFIAMAFAIVAPGVPVLFSLVVPPRARTFGFGVNDLYALPGLIFPVVAALVADEFGFRWGMLSMVPVFLFGAVIIGSAGGSVRRDIDTAQMAALAAAEYRRARDAGTSTLLICRGVEVCYGSVQVLFSVNFDVADGEIVALLGTNGAGKSTLLRAIAGVASTSGGTIIFDGRDVTLAGPHTLLREGVCYMPGGRSVFPGLTVDDNLRIAMWQRAGVDDVAIEDALLRFPVLQERRGDSAGDLSGGQQQMLGLAMALLAQPRLLMIDELSLGLAPSVVAELLEVVREIHRAGTTIVIVEQSVNVALEFAQRAVFMEKGEVRFEGRTVDLLERDDLLRSVFLPSASANLVDDAVAAKVVGEHFTLPHGTRGVSLADRAVVLRGEQLSVSFGGIRAVDDVTLEVVSGEILGLIGPNGAGKTTLLDLLSGYLRPDSGRIILNGHDVTRRRPDERVALGLGRSFQDARLFPSMVVSEALAVAHHRHLGQRGALSAVFRVPDVRIEERLLGHRVDELIELLGLMAYRDKFVSELSTGTRRIVDIGCALAVSPTVLLLDEPSSGIAQREAEALGSVLRRIRDNTGTALVIIEHDMPLLAGISDRLLALDLGAVVAEGPPEAVLNDDRVVSSYLGTNRNAITRSGVVPTRA